VSGEAYRLTFVMPDEKVAADDRTNFQEGKERAFFVYDARRSALAGVKVPKVPRSCVIAATLERSIASGGCR
jgi:hypothetical protein